MKSVMISIRIIFSLNSDSFQFSLRYDFLLSSELFHVQRFSFQTFSNSVSFKLDEENLRHNLQSYLEKDKILKKFAYEEDKA